MRACKWNVSTGILKNHFEENETQDPEFFQLVKHFQKKVNIYKILIEK